MAQRYATRTAKEHAAFILPYLRPGLSLLDCGCGPGTITLGLAEAVAPGPVVGIDHDPVHIEAARHLAGHRGGTIVMTRFPTAENIVAVLDDLGLNRVHVAGRLDTDWTRFAVEHGDRVASLALVFPSYFDPNAVRSHASRLTLVEDDRAATKRGRDAVAGMPGARVITVADYVGEFWTDVAADHPGTILSALTENIERCDPANVALAAGDHEAEGIAYHVEGTGPPLLLLPLVIAPSQWEPLLPEMRERFTLITLGSKHLGFVPILEERGRTGYRRVVMNVLDEMEIEPGQRLLEVGCGTGVLSRAIARRFESRCPITAVDINPYLLNEARSLAAQEGLANAIDFRAGSIERLPFEDSTFDAVTAFTVLEEVDAGRALSELVRVTKPGGRVGAVVRATDRPWQINLQIDDSTRAKVEAPAGSDESAACAEASLYRRF